jgi:hypothetical protein
MTNDADDGVNEQHAKEFFEAYGRAMLQWQYVEANLFLIFSSLIRGRDHHAVSAAYHAVVNLNSKLDMITEVMRVLFPEAPLLSDWERLRKKVSKQSANRNVLAHFVVLGHLSAEAEGPVTLRLARSIYDVRHRTPAEYDLNQIATWDKSFGILADKLDIFGKELVVALKW